MITKEEIVKAIADNDYAFYGLRCDFNNYQLGDFCECSHQWWQDADNLEGYEELTEEELSSLYNEEIRCYDGGELTGTCAVFVNENNIEDAINRIKKYYNFGGEIILIAGDWAEAGNDVGEIIIRNAVVIAK